MEAEIAYSVDFAQTLTFGDAFRMSRITYLPRVSAVPELLRPHMVELRPRPY